MATAAATYLYALAGLSVSFVGFSTLLIVFRQSAGGRLTDYDSYFVLTFMQAGFIVSAGALMPLLLVLLALPEAAALRVASAITANPHLPVRRGRPGAPPCRHRRSDADVRAVAPGIAGARWCGPVTRRARHAAGAASRALRGRVDHYFGDLGDRFPVGATRHASGTQ